MRAPKVHLYTFCWNDARMLPFFLDHYREVDLIVVLDDGSTDGSFAYLESKGAEVRPTNRDLRTSIHEFGLSVVDQVWKESRGEADWVLLPDVDEMLMAPGRRLRDVLAKATGKGWTSIPAQGFEMVGERFPETGRPILS